MRQKLLFLAIATLFAFSACKKETEDTIPPTIDSATFFGGFLSFDSIDAGTVLNIQVFASDNKDLSQVKVEFHNDFDGHSTRNTAFLQTLIGNVKGTSASFQTTCLIPTTVASGPYHMIAEAVDKSGLRSDYYKIEFNISNGSEPEIYITNPNPFPTPVYAIGDTIPLTGYITDNDDLASVRCYLENENDFSKIYNQTFILSDTADVNWDMNEISLAGLPIQITSGATPGFYKLVILAIDNNNNHWRTKIRIQVQ